MVVNVEKERKVVGRCQKHRKYHVLEAGEDEKQRKYRVVEVEKVKKLGKKTCLCGGKLWPFDSPQVHLQRGETGEKIRGIVRFWWRKSEKQCKSCVLVDEVLKRV